jgi:hypothetical protein
MECIVDHKTDDHDAECSDMYIKHGSNKQARKTTKGWHFFIEWKDGTTSWEHMTDMKNINPVEFDEYAVSENLNDVFAFVWRVPHVLKKCRRFITAVTKIYHNMTHKFGNEVPQSWDNCVILDTKNGNTMCQDTVRKDMKNIRIAFTILNGDKEIPPTYQDIHCHMICDVKMEDFR